MECINNLKQIALAALDHEQAANNLPTGGWGYNWVGDPDRSHGRRQPGGFFYNILPYMEQKNLHDSPKVGDPAGKLRMSALMLMQPVPGFNCPSRRDLPLNPVNPIYDSIVNAEKAYDIDPKPLWFHADYKANGGSAMHQWVMGPASWADGDDPGPTGYFQIRRLTRKTPEIIMEFATNTASSQTPISPTELPIPTWWAKKISIPTSTSPVSISPTIIHF